MISLLKRLLAGKASEGKASPAVSPIQKMGMLEQSRMRARSGDIQSEDPLVHFIFLLAASKLPIGDIEELLTQVQLSGCQNRHFTNGWLAEWAKDAAGRLRSCDCDCDCDSQDEDEEDYDAEDEE